MQKNHFEAFVPTLLICCWNSYHYVRHIRYVCDCQERFVNCFINFNGINDSSHNFPDIWTFDKMCETIYLKFLAKKVQNQINNLEKIDDIFHQCLLGFDWNNHLLLDLNGLLSVERV